MDPIDPTIVYWSVMVLLGCITAISAISGIQSRKSDACKRDDDKMADLSTEIKLVGADVKATREMVTEVKSTLKSHGDQLIKMDGKITRTELVAHEALDKANSAHERMDAAGMPSAYAVRLGIGNDKEEEDR